MITKFIFIFRTWDESLLELALESLEEDLPLPPGAPGGMETYRKSLTLTCFFKFYLQVLDQLCKDQVKYQYTNTS